jgi:hypothetical protein
MALKSEEEIHVKVDDWRKSWMRDKRQQQVVKDDKEE